MAIQSRRCAMQRRYAADLYLLGGVIIPHSGLTGRRRYQRVLIMPLLTLGPERTFVAYRRIHLMPCRKSSVSRLCHFADYPLGRDGALKEALLSERYLLGSCRWPRRMRPEWEGFGRSAQRVHARQAALDAA